MKYLSTKEILYDTLVSIKSLGESGETPDAKLIHKTRVSIKRLRARLKLIKQLSGHLIETDEIVVELKKLSQYLSAQRNYDVAVKLLDSIICNEENSKLVPVFVKIRDSIITSSSVEPLNYTDIQKITIEIWNCYMRMSDTKIKICDIVRSVQKLYRKTCKNGKQVLKKQNCNEIHEWRKQVKKLIYQNEILDKSEHDIYLPVKELIRLGDRLGQIHDLCFLEQMIEEHHDDINQYYDTLDGEFIHHYIANRRIKIIEKCRHLHNKISAR